jgi:hypothetical protein
LPDFEDLAGFFYILRGEMDKNKKIRLIAIICLIVIVPLGLYTKAYVGLGQDWINNSSGGVLYEIFFCLLILLIIPKAQPGSIVGSVFFFTCVIEFMQLWHPPFLQAIRRTFIGATLLGTSFAGTDFIYYVIGSVLGWLILLTIIRIASGKPTKHEIRHQANM